MPANNIERVNYYQRQYLGARDFIDAQNYHRERHNRHNIGSHLWGIVVGLELEERMVEGGGDAREVVILPGVAIDGYGREIVVFAPIILDSALFLRFGTPNHYKVWIGYEEETANSEGDQCQCKDDQFNRIIETYRIYVEPDDPQPTEVIIDAERVDETHKDLRIPPDLSVPYQELPDDDTEFWLISLGAVRWDGNQFVEAAEGRLRQDRQYIGVVGDRLLAPDGALTIRDRYTTPLEETHAGVAVGVEGSLQVERDISAKADVHVDGGMVDFRLDDGMEEGAYLVQRITSETVAGSELQVKIGDDSEGENRFVIVSEDDEDVFSVLDDGTTAIHGDTEINGDVEIADENNLLLAGGQLQLQSPGATTPDWGIKVDNEALQFTEPDNSDRIVFEILDVSADTSAPAIRLHGEQDATLSADQLIDLTDGGDTELHTHPGATTTEKGMVEIAEPGETKSNGTSGARLVIPANDGRILTESQKDELTNGGQTTLHRHPNGMLNNVRTEQLSAANSISTVTVNFSVTQRVVAFIHISAMDPLADFDADDGFFADILRVDGSRPSGQFWHGGPHLGAYGTDDNLLPALYTGLAKTITFRLRSVQNAQVWADAIVFFEEQ